MYVYVYIICVLYIYIYTHDTIRYDTMRCDTIIYYTILRESERCLVGCCSAEVPSYGTHKSRNDSN